MPFNEAAEYGTRKVINDHSTIAVLVTTDGSFGEIPRESYIAAEEKTAAELKAAGKPFVIIFNSATPQEQKTVNEAYALEEKFGVPVALVNCLQLDGEDIRKILELILLEFPITEVAIKLPGYLNVIGEEHPLNISVTDCVMNLAQNAEKIKDVKPVFSQLSDNEFIQSADTEDIDLGCGKVKINVKLLPELYYQILSELAGEEIGSEAELMGAIKSLSEAKKSYGKFADAIAEVNETGYGIVMPKLEDLKLQEPEIVKQPGGYGVKLRASAPSIHMIKVDTETEINPVFGTEQQSEDLVKYLLSEFTEDPTKIWNTNMFGRTLHELVNEGLNAKIEHMSADSRKRMGETLERIINEGSGGLICIIL